MVTYTQIPVEIWLRTRRRLIPLRRESMLCFMEWLGNKVFWFYSVMYKSLLDANVYTPEQYPAGWEEQ